MSTDGDGEQPADHRNTAGDRAGSGDESSVQAGGVQPLPVWVVSTTPTDADVIDPIPDADPIPPPTTTSGDRPPLLAPSTVSGDDTRSLPTGAPPDGATTVDPARPAATGPLLGRPSAADPSSALPTGPVPVTAVTTRPLAATSSLRAGVQAAAVLLAAAVVGTVVYSLLASSDGGDETAGEVIGPDPDADGDLALTPGPGELGSNARDTSKRGTAGLGQRPDDPDGGQPSPTGSTIDTGEADDGSDRASGPLSSPDPDGPPAPAGPTTIQDSTSLPTSGSVAATSASTTEAPSTIPTSSASTTAPSSTAPSSSVTGSLPNPSTTTTTTATTASTTSRPPTTTRPPTTPAPTDPLIAAPPDGFSRIWERPTVFRGNPVDRADRYCWYLTGSGGDTKKCTDSGRYEHPTPAGPARRRPVKVRVEALAANGRVLRSEEIEGAFIARESISEPEAGSRHRMDERLRLRSGPIPEAERYCWTLTQGSTSTGQMCQERRTLDLRPGDDRLDPFEPGPLSILSVVRGDGVVLGRQTIQIRLVAAR